MEELQEKKEVNFLLMLALAIGIALIMIFYTRSQASRKVISFNQEIQNIESQSDSDEIESIEKDLEETDLTEIDRELQDIESEINQVYQ